jgi:hypothetical protein
MSLSSSGCEKRWVKSRVSVPGRGTSTEGKLMMRDPSGDLAGAVAASGGEAGVSAGVCATSAAGAAMKAAVSRIARETRRRSIIRYLHARSVA